jgi:hypothetical protein
MGFFEERNYSVEEAKIFLLGELEVWYSSRVLDVFDTDVLGTMHRYYCSEADQLRMMNGKVANVSMPLMCGVVPSIADNDPIYDWKVHTSAECGKVHTDYVQFALASTQQYQSWKAEIVTYTTMTQCINMLHILLPWTANI